MEPGKESYYQRRKRTLRAEGKCIHCAVNFSEGLCCDECRPKRNASSRKWYAMKRADNYCVNCGQNDATEGVLCSECKVKKNRNNND